MADASAEGFRDQLYNVDLQGRRVGFFPKRPKGKLYNWRTVVSYILLGVMFGFPWIKIDGEPMMLLNVFERKFIVFGQVFWPQDFHLLVFAIISLFLFVILFTVIYGRIWCGWLCPQTIFLEMVYRKIEFWIEGDAAAQRRLAKAPWTTKKIFKKTFKQTIFVAIAIAVSHTVLAWIVGVDELFLYVTDSPVEHLGLFIAVIANSIVFYLVFSWFRETACILVCPYGRLQGVLLDEKSVVISYDFKRGEPRKKIKRGEEQGENGDCIDCNHCVAVCPTGIDIRNGTQLECVNCTACIDACDSIMEKVNRPKGLIRFASHKQIKDGEKFKFSTRAIAYSTVLVVLLGVFTSLVIFRNEIETTVLRAPGVTFKKDADGLIVNIYELTIVNKTDKEKELAIELEHTDAQIDMSGGNEFKVGPGDLYESRFIVRMPKEKIASDHEKIEVGICEGDEIIETVKVGFRGPIVFN